MYLVSLQHRPSLTQSLVIHTLVIHADARGISGHCVKAKTMTAWGSPDGRGEQESAKAKQSSSTAFTCGKSTPIFFTWTLNKSINDVNVEIRATSRHTFNSAHDNGFGRCYSTGTELF